MACCMLHASIQHFAFHFLCKCNRDSQTFCVFQIFLPFSTWKVACHMHFVVSSMRFLSVQSSNWVNKGNENVQNNTNICAKQTSKFKKKQQKYHCHKKMQQYQKKTIWGKQKKKYTYKKWRGCHVYGYHKRAAVHGNATCNTHTHII